MNQSCSAWWRCYSPINTESLQNHAHYSHQIESLTSILPTLSSPTSEDSIKSLPRTVYGQHGGTILPFLLLFSSHPSSRTWGGDGAPRTTSLRWWASSRPLLFLASLDDQAKVTGPRLDEGVRQLVDPWRTWRLPWAPATPSESQWPVVPCAASRST